MDGKSFGLQKRKDKPTPAVLIAHPSADLYGSDRVLLESVKAFVDTGASVVVTMPANGPLVSKITALGAIVELCETPVLRKAMMTPKGLIQLMGVCIPAAVKSARMLRGSGAATVYVNTQTIPLWLIVGRLMRKKVVLHVHEAEGNAPAVVRLALAAPALFAQKIISNSNFSTDVLTSTLPLLRKRTEVIYNGVPGPEDPAQAPRKNLVGAVQLIFMGRLSQRKGIDVAIKALAQLRDEGTVAQLSIVGAIYPGNEAFELSLREQAQHFGVAEAITWHGFHASVWPFLAKADVVLVPSRLDEPFGNTAVEAVLAQRPLIVSETSGLKEAAAGYSSAVFVEPGNAVALADAVRKISQNWSQWRQAAVLESEVARQRHAPELYRTRLTKAALDVVHIATDTVVTVDPETKESL